MTKPSRSIVMPDRIDQAPTALISPLFIDVSSSVLSPKMSAWFAQSEDCTSTEIYLHFNRNLLHFDRRIPALRPKVCCTSTEKPLHFNRTKPALQPKVIRNYINETAPELLLVTRKFVYLTLLDVLRSF
jgi:hypothetical protein